MAFGHQKPALAADWTNDTGADVANGDILVVNALTVIALGDIKDGETGVVALSGEWEGPKGAGELKHFEAVWFDDGAKQWTKTEVSGVAPSYVIKPAAADAEKVCVLLNGR